MRYKLNVVILRTLGDVLNRPIEHKRESGVNPEQCPLL